jgi:hypothetical protein
MYKYVYKDEAAEFDEELSRCMWSELGEVL